MFQEEFNAAKSPKTLAYVLKNDTANRRCGACGSVVLKEPSVEGYPYQCMNCDENKYEIETYLSDHPHSDAEFEKICCDTRDLLLLDEN